MFSDSSNTSSQPYFHSEKGTREKEKEKTKPGVLSHITSNEFRFGNGHVERRLRQLGLRSDEEQEEPHELRDDERVAEPVHAEDGAAGLGVHDALHVEGAGLDDHADDGEHQR